MAGVQAEDGNWNVCLKDNSHHSTQPIYENWSCTPHTLPESRHDWSTVTEFCADTMFTTPCHARMQFLAKNFMGQLIEQYSEGTWMMIKHFEDINTLQHKRTLCIELLEIINKPFLPTASNQLVHFLWTAMSLKLATSLPLSNKTQIILLFIILGVVMHQRLMKLDQKTFLLQ